MLETAGSVKNFDPVERANCYRQFIYDLVAGQRKVGFFLSQLEGLMNLEKNNKNVCLSFYQMFDECWHLCLFTFFVPKFRKVICAPRLFCLISAALFLLVKKTSLTT